MELVYILGPGHCGSTLLSLMLNRHPDVIAVSEIVSLNADRAGFAGDEDFRDAPFWQSVAADFEKSNGGPFWQVPFHHRALRDGVAPAEWNARNLDALRSISNVAGAGHIADASKQPGRVEALVDIPGLTVRVIYLVRDARAVVHSYDRKYKSILHGIRKVRRIERRARTLQARLPDENWLEVRYEDLVTDPREALARICGLLNAPFDNQMLDPDPASFVGIGGNRMRNRPVKAITLDEAWRKQMPMHKRLVSGLALRTLNRRHGYES